MSTKHTSSSEIIDNMMIDNINKIDNKKLLSDLISEKFAKQIDDMKNGNGEYLFDFADLTEMMSSVSREYSTTAIIGCCCSNKK